MTLIPWVRLSKIPRPWVKFPDSQTWNRFFNRVIWSTKLENVTQIIICNKCNCADKTKKKRLSGFCVRLCLVEELLFCFHRTPCEKYFKQVRTCSKTDCNSEFHVNWVTAVGLTLKRILSSLFVQMLVDFCP